jgi:hypothetical protein
MNLASIETIKGIRPHPSADKLEFATVLGYDCLVPVGKFVPGQRVVMIQPDTVLPDEPWSQTYLKFCKTRVKAIPKNECAFPYCVWRSLSAIKPLPVG